MAARSTYHRRLPTVQAHLRPHADGQSPAASRSSIAAAAAADPQPAESLTVAAAQISTQHDISANLRKVEARVEEAAARGVQILLFHEGCLTGYPLSAEICEGIDWALLAAAEARVAELAKRHGMAILVGSNSRKQGGILNDLLIIDEHGAAMGRYAKTWRAGEPHFDAGSGPVIFRLWGVECTCLICHDLRYPELTRLGVTAGARIVFMPNNEGGLISEDKLQGYK